MHKLSSHRTRLLWAAVAGAALVVVAACADEPQATPAPAVAQAAPAISSLPTQPSATTPAPTASPTAQAALTNNLPTTTPTPVPRVCTGAVGATALRTGPATIYNPVRPPVIVERGETVTFLARLDQGTWVLVATAAGSSGWAPSGFLRCDDSGAVPVVTPPPTPSPTAEPEATPSTLRLGMPNDPLPAASGQAPRPPRRGAEPPRQQPGSGGSGSSPGGVSNSPPVSVPTLPTVIEPPTEVVQPLPTITPPPLPTVVPRP